MKVATTTGAKWMTKQRLLIRRYDLIWDVKVDIYCTVGLRSPLEVFIVRPQSRSTSATAIWVKGVGFFLVGKAALVLVLPQVNEYFPCWIVSIFTLCVPEDFLHNATMPVSESYLVCWENYEMHSFDDWVFSQLFFRWLRKLLALDGFATGCNWERKVWA